MQHFVETAPVDSLAREHLQRARQAVPAEQQVVHPAELTGPHRDGMARVTDVQDPGACGDVGASLDDTTVAQRDADASVGAHEGA